MDTCHRKTMLYAFFLEISKNVLDDIVHRRQKLPRNSRDMYLYLQDRFSNYDQGGYTEKINNCGFLLDYQKRKLLPENGMIDLEGLDFTMYMNISKLLGGNINPELIDYMKNLRNCLCHVSFSSIQQGMSQKSFRDELDMMEEDFKYYGVNVPLVDTCKAYILRRI